MTPNTLQSPIEYPKCTIGRTPYQCRATFNSSYFLADLEATFPTVALPPDAPAAILHKNAQVNMNRALALASLVLGSVSADGQWTEAFPIDEAQGVGQQLITAARTLRKQIQPDEFPVLNAAVKTAMDLMSEAMKAAQPAPPRTEEPTPTLQ